MSTGGYESTIERRKDELLRGDIGAAVAAQKHAEFLLRIAEWHLRKAVELSAGLDAVDLRKDLTGKVEQPLIDQANSLADPMIENARARGRAAQAALDVLTTSEAPRREHG